MRSSENSRSRSQHASSQPRPCSLFLQLYTRNLRDVLVLHFEAPKPRSIMHEAICQGCTYRRTSKQVAGVPMPLNTHPIVSHKAHPTRRPFLRSALLQFSMGTCTAGLPQFSLRPTCQRAFVFLGGDLFGCVGCVFVPFSWRGAGAGRGRGLGSWLIKVWKQQRAVRSNRQFWFWFSGIWYTCEEIQVFISASVEGICFTYGIAVFSN